MESLQPLDNGIHRAKLIEVHPSNISWNLLPAKIFNSQNSAETYRGQRVAAWTLCDANWLEQKNTALDLLVPVLLLLLLHSPRLRLVQSHRHCEQDRAQNSKNTIENAPIKPYFHLPSRRHHHGRGAILYLPPLLVVVEPMAVPYDAEGGQWSWNASHSSMAFFLFTFQK